LVSQYTNHANSPNADGLKRELGIKGNKAKLPSVVEEGEDTLLELG